MGIESDKAVVKEKYPDAIAAHQVLPRTLEQTEMRATREQTSIVADQTTNGLVLGTGHTPADAWAAAAKFVKEQSE